MPKQQSSLLPKAYYNLPRKYLRQKMLPQKLKYDLYYIYYTKASPQNIATMIVLYIEAEDKYYFKK